MKTTNKTKTPTGRTLRVAMLAALYPRERLTVSEWAARYRKLTLWTHSVLIAARRIYEQAGFKLIDTWTHDDFGKKLVAENWDLQLAG